MVLMPSRFAFHFGGEIAAHVAFPGGTCINQCLGAGSAWAQFEGSTQSSSEWRQLRWVVEFFPWQPLRRGQL